jgi:hypothetical protein
MIFKNENIINAALFNIEDFKELPSCGVEDVDRSVFKLFSEILPFYFEENGKQKKYPAIFASGERAVILKNRRPLRDNSGALILPLISIMRTGLTQDPEGYGISPTGEEIVIKKKIYSENLAFKEEINENNLSNQDNTIKQNTVGGNDSTRMFSAGLTNTSMYSSKKNIYETYTIPTPRFFNASYNVTFWTSTQVQMNDVFESLLSVYPTMSRSFLLKSDKGYNFTANLNADFDSETNSDGMNDAERLIKSTIELNVNGYVINSKSPGLLPTIKRYISSPRVTFETILGPPPKIKDFSQESSNDPNNYIETSWDNEFDPLPGSRLGLETKTSTTDVTIGKTNKTISNRYYLERVNPESGKLERVEYIIKDSNHRKGETVLREVKVL